MSKKSSTRPLRSCARLVWPLIQTPQVLDRFADAGCEITSDNAVRFKRELVEGCLETGERRDSTWEDLATITRVADALHRSARHLEIAPPRAGSLLDRILGYRTLPKTQLQLPILPPVCPEGRRGCGGPEGPGGRRTHRLHPRGVRGRRDARCRELTANSGRVSRQHQSAQDGDRRRTCDRHGRHSSEDGDHSRCRGR